MRLGEQELGVWLADAAGPLLRHETAAAYDVASDGGDFARYVAGEPAPDPDVGAGWREFVRSHDVRRVRVLSGPPSEFLRFEMEWQYTANAAAGEAIRIVDLTEHDALERLLGAELWVTADGVARMHYDGEHRFSHAELVTGAAAAAESTAAWAAFHAGEPFASWWARHPEHHRDAWRYDGD